MKKILFWVFMGICIGIVPYFNTIANVSRVVPCVGGELFIPVIPALCWVIYDSIKSNIEVMENGSREEF